MLASAPNVVIAVHPELPAKSLKELIALAKKQPGKLQYASAGVGTFLHLGGELFKLTAGIDLLHVPFKGAAPALIDVVGGHTQLMFATIPSSHRRISAPASSRSFGVGGDAAQRADPGRSDHRRSRIARLRGRQLDRHRRARRHAAGRSSPGCTRRFRQILDTPEMQKQFVDRRRRHHADELRASSATFIATEMAKWGRVVKEAGIKPE